MNDALQLKKITGTPTTSDGPLLPRVLSPNKGEAIRRKPYTATGFGSVSARVAHQPSSKGPTRSAFSLEHAVPVMVGEGGAAVYSGRDRKGKVSIAFQIDADFSHAEYADLLLTACGTILDGIATVEGNAGQIRNEEQ